MVEGSPTCPVTSDSQTSPPITSLSLAHGGSGAALLPSPLKSPSSVSHTLDSWDSVLEANACSSYLPQAEFRDICTSLAWTIIWKQKLRKKWLLQIFQTQSCQKIKTNRSHRAVRSAHYTGSSALGYFPHYSLHTLPWAQWNCTATNQMCLAAASKVDAGWRSSMGLWKTLESN